MYSPSEETEILRGIDEIIYNLKKVPLSELAFFLVKEQPKIAQELNDAISLEIKLRKIKNDTK